MEDYSIRCDACSTGVGEGGTNIGGLVAQYIVACETPDGTFPVAKIGRCINIGGFRPDGSMRPSCEKIHDQYFKSMPDMDRLGLTKSNILACCKQSRGYVFTLGELKAGNRDLVGMAHKQFKNAPPPLRPINRDFNESAEKASDEFVEIF